LEEQLNHKFRQREAGAQVRYLNEVSVLGWEGGLAPARCFDAIQFSPSETLR
jgi:hypothetical protein